MSGVLFRTRKYPAAPIIPPVKFRIRSSISTLLSINSCAVSIKMGSRAQDRSEERTDCLFFHRRGSPNPQGKNITIFPTIFTRKTEK